MTQNQDFFLRYYIGHKGAYGHQYLDFEVDGKGKLKYLNNSEYKSDSLISKEAYLSQTVIEQIKRIIKESDILQQSDKKWPKPDKIGKQQLSVRIGDKQVTFRTSKIGSSAQVQKTEDPQGLNIQNVLSFPQQICTLGLNQFDYSQIFAHFQYIFIMKRQPKKVKKTSNYKSRRMNQQRKQAINRIRRKMVRESNKKFQEELERYSIGSEDSENSSQSSLASSRSSSNGKRVTIDESNNQSYEYKQWEKLRKNETIQQKSQQSQVSSQQRGKQILNKMSIATRSRSSRQNR